MINKLVDGIMPLGKRRKTKRNFYDFSGPENLGFSMKNQRLTVNKLYLNMVYLLQ